MSSEQTSPWALPPEVIELDHHLEEEEASRNTLELMKLRWHWCADPANQDRVPIRTYARQVGRDESTVRRDVHAWERLKARHEDRGELPSGRSLDDLRELARIDDEMSTAAEALAGRYDVSVQVVRKAHRVKLLELVNRTREAAQAKGTSFDAEFDAALDAMTEQPPAMPTPETPHGDAAKNPVSGLWARLTKTRRGLEELLEPSQELVWRLGQQQPRFVERPRAVSGPRGCWSRC